MSNNPQNFNRLYNLDDITRQQRIEDVNNRLRRHFEAGVISESIMDRYRLAPDSDEHQVSASWGAVRNISRSPERWRRESELIPQRNEATTNYFTQTISPFIGEFNQTNQQGLQLEANEQETFGVKTYRMTMTGPGNEVKWSTDVSALAPYGQDRTNQVGRLVIGNRVADVDLPVSGPGENPASRNVQEQLVRSLFGSETHPIKLSRTGPKDRDFQGNYLNPLDTATEVGFQSRVAQSKRLDPRVFVTQSYAGDRPIDLNDYIQNGRGELNPLLVSLQKEGYTHVTNPKQYLGKDYSLRQGTHVFSNESYLDVPGWYQDEAGKIHAGPGVDAFKALSKSAQLGGVRGEMANYGPRAGEFADWKEGNVRTAGSNMLSGGYRERTFVALTSAGIGEGQGLVNQRTAGTLWERRQKRVEVGVNEQGELNLDDETKTLLAQIQGGESVNVGKSGLTINGQRVKFAGSWDRADLTGVTTDVRDTAKGKRGFLVFDTYRSGAEVSTKTAGTKSLDVREDFAKLGSGWNDYDRIITTPKNWNTFAASIFDSMSSEQYRDTMTRYAQRFPDRAPQNVDINQGAIENGVYIPARHGSQATPYLMDVFREMVVPNALQVRSMTRTIDNAMLPIVQSNMLVGQSEADVRAGLADVMAKGGNLNELPSWVRNITDLGNGKSQIDYLVPGLSTEMLVSKSPELSRGSGRFNFETIVNRAWLARQNGDTLTGSVLNSLFSPGQANRLEIAKAAILNDQSSKGYAVEVPADSVFDLGNLTVEQRERYRSLVNQKVGTDATDAQRSVAQLEAIQEITEGKMLRASIGQDNIYLPSAGAAHSLMVRGAAGKTIGYVRSYANAIDQLMANPEMTEDVAGMLASTVMKQAQLTKSSGFRKNMLSTKSGAVFGHVYTSDQALAPNQMVMRENEIQNRLVKLANAQGLDVNKEEIAEFLTNMRSTGENPTAYVERNPINESHLQRTMTLQVLNEQQYGAMGGTKKVGRAPIVSDYFAYAQGGDVDADRLLGLLAASMRRDDQGKLTADWAAATTNERMTEAAQENVAGELWKHALSNTGEKFWKGASAKEITDLVRNPDPTAMLEMLTRPGGMLNQTDKGFEPEALGAASQHHRTAKINMGIAYNMGRMMLPGSMAGDEQYTAVSEFIGGLYQEAIDKKVDLWDSSGNTMSPAARDLQSLMKTNMVTGYYFTGYNADPKQWEELANGGETVANRNAKFNPGQMVSRAIKSALSMGEFDESNTDMMAALLTPSSASDDTKVAIRGLVGRGFAARGDDTALSNVASQITTAIGGDASVIAAGNKRVGSVANAAEESVRQGNYAALSDAPLIQTVMSAAAWHTQQSEKNRAYTRKGQRDKITNDVISALGMQGAAREAIVNVVSRGRKMDTVSEFTREMVAARDAFAQVSGGMGTPVVQYMNALMEQMGIKPDANASQAVNEQLGAIKKKREGRSYITKETTNARAEAFQRRAEQLRSGRTIDVAGNVRGGINTYENAVAFSPSAIGDPTKLLAYSLSGAGLIDFDSSRSGNGTGGAPDAATFGKQIHEFIGGHADQVAASLGIGDVLGSERGATGVVGGIKWAGRYDMLATNNDKVTLYDFKTHTSGNISADTMKQYQAQMELYGHMLSQAGMDVDQLALVDINREELTKAEQALVAGGVSPEEARIQAIGQVGKIQSFGFNPGQISENLQGFLSAAGVSKEALQLGSGSKGSDMGQRLMLKPQTAATSADKRAALAHAHMTLSNIGANMKDDQPLFGLNKAALSQGLTSPEVRKTFGITTDNNPDLGAIIQSGGSGDGGTPPPVATASPATPSGGNFGGIGSDQLEQIINTAFEKFGVGVQDAMQMLRDTPIAQMRDTAIADVQKSMGTLAPIGGFSSVGEELRSYRQATANGGQLSNWQIQRVNNVEGALRKIQSVNTAAAHWKRANDPIGQQILSLGLGENPNVLAAQRELMNMDEQGAVDFSRPSLLQIASQDQQENRYDAAQMKIAREQAVVERQESRRMEAIQLGMLPHLPSGERQQIISTLEGRVGETGENALSPFERRALRTLQGVEAREARGEAVEQRNVARERNAAAEYAYLQMGEQDRREYRSRILDRPGEEADGLSDKFKARLQRDRERIISAPTRHGLGDRTQSEFLGQVDSLETAVSNLGKISEEAAKGVERLSDKQAKYVENAAKTYDDLNSKIEAHQRAVDEGGANTPAESRQALEEATRRGLWSGGEASGKLKELREAAYDSGLYRRVVGQRYTELLEEAEPEPPTIAEKFAPFLMRGRERERALRKGRREGWYGTEGSLERLGLEALGTAAALPYQALHARYELRGIQQEFISPMMQAREVYMGARQREMQARLGLDAFGGYSQFNSAEYQSIMSPTVLAATRQYYSGEQADRAIGGITNLANRFLGDRNAAGAMTLGQMIMGGASTGGVMTGWNPFAIAGGAIVGAGAFFGGQATTMATDRQARVQMLADPSKDRMGQIGYDLQKIARKFINWVGNVDDETSEGGKRDEIDEAKAEVVREALKSGNVWAYANNAEVGDADPGRLYKNGDVLSYRKNKLQDRTVQTLIAQDIIKRKYGEVLTPEQQASIRDQALEVVGPLGSTFEDEKRYEQVADVFAMGASTNTDVGKLASSIVSASGGQGGDIRSGAYEKALTGLGALMKDKERGAYYTRELPGIINQIGQISDLQRAMGFETTYGKKPEDVLHYSQGIADRLAGIDESYNKGQITAEQRDAEKRRIQEDFSSQGVWAQLAPTSSLFQQSMMTGQTYGYMSGLTGAAYQNVRTWMPTAGQISNAFEARGYTPMMGDALSAAIMKGLPTTAQANDVQRIAGYLQQTGLMDRYIKADDIAGLGALGGKAYALDLNNVNYEGLAGSLAAINRWNTNDPTQINNARIQAIGANFNLMMPKVLGGSGMTPTDINAYNTYMNFAGTAANAAGAGNIRLSTSDVRQFFGLRTENAQGMIGAYGTATGQNATGLGYMSGALSRINAAYAMNTDEGLRLGAQLSGQRDTAFGFYASGARYGAATSDVLRAADKLSIVTDANKFGRYMAAAQGDTLSISQMVDTGALPEWMKRVQTTGELAGSQMGYAQVSSAMFQRRTAINAGATGGFVRGDGRYGVTQLLGMSELQLQHESHALEIEGREYDFALAQRQTRRQRATVTGQGLGEFGLSEGKGEWFYEDWGIRQQREQQDWSYRQRGQQLALSREQANYQYQYQREGMGIQRKHQVTEQQWGLQDLAYQRNVNELQFGFSMIDADENIRYARGRERRVAMRHRDEAVTMHSMQTGQMDREEDRAKRRIKWGDELYEREKRNFEQSRQFQQRNFQLEEQNYRKEREFITEQRKLEDEQRQFRRAIQVIEMNEAQESLNKHQELKRSVDDLNGAMSISNREYKEAATSIQNMVNTLQMLRAVAAVSQGQSLSPGTPYYYTTKQTGAGYNANPTTHGESEFAEGGYTGTGSKYEPAGVVHRGEYVVPQGGSLVQINPETVQLLTAILKELEGIHADGGNAVINVVTSDPQRAMKQGLSLYDQSFAN